MTDRPKILRAKDYKKPDFQIPTVDLEFIIHSEDNTTVRSKMTVIAQTDEKKPLELLGENQELISVKIDGAIIDKSRYTLTDKSLVIPDVPDNFILEIESRINPAKNESLEGLYKSEEILCTQCEAMGFRHIAYHLDRPDVMGRFTTRIEADKDRFPTLLSNGNLLEAGDLQNNRHYTIWEDPFLKPTYLFALIAGDLGEVKDTFKTMSGRDIDIRFYVDKGDEPKAAHAVESLKQSMAWDEKMFGRECDLDRYMVVAVGSFNFGAMENKGLNIFNSKYVLADPTTATDDDFENVQGVIGHEYFHNWTGNRVTLRDWFQLTLKEGLTVYRDQRFTADHTSVALKRIKDVNMLRNSQFPEDSSPNSHPIKPAEVVNMENFYTATVYEKGAEVIRMIDTLIGRSDFRKGMDKYFELYDGNAVTTEDFVNAMELGSGKDLTQFKRWYHQSGTPVCEVSTSYDEEEKRYTVTVRQSNPDRNGEEQDPLHIPLSIGLIGKDGKDIVSKVLELTEKEQTFVFEDIDEKPVPSLFRGFSAPVKVRYDYTTEELAFLLAHDSDAFNRYEAGQRLATSEMKSMIGAMQKGKGAPLDDDIITAFGDFIRCSETDPAFTAQGLGLPSVAELIEDMQVCDYDSASTARKALMARLALSHEDLLLDGYDRLDDGKKYSNDKESIAKRKLKNSILSYLVATGKEEHFERAYEQFQKVDNMTDSIAALYLLASDDNKRRAEALQSFHDRWKDNPLVMDKWFVSQAMSQRENVLDDVIALEKHPAYDQKNPNRVRSLLGGFIGNHTHFHDINGSGYTYLADKIIEIDKFNNTLAAGLAKGFKKYPKLDEERQTLVRTQLQRILDAKPSDKVYEIVSKTIESV
ncbi:aminopeptidase N [Candidatus Woesearchaeota archaeon CG08_land_8_20_14_0_20_43_7]|nr:MAG: aminopeptidase N [Candidatus Woesearchaeota archaeon CG08_land_8_20_14_0_20_43_7]